VLVEAPTLARLEQSYRVGLAAWGARCAAPGHGRVTEADIEALFEAVHGSVPAGTDRAVVAALDSRMARLIEIAANIASGAPPVT